MSHYQIPDPLLYASHRLNTQHNNQAINLTFLHIEGGFVFSGNKLQRKGLN